jgi:hypothetical protein
MNPPLYSVLTSFPAILGTLKDNCGHRMRSQGYSSLSISIQSDEDAFALLEDLLETVFHYKVRS